MLAGSGSGCARSEGHLYHVLGTPSREPAFVIKAAACAGEGCAHGRKVRLTWNPNPSAEKVTGYTVYFGRNADTVDQKTSDLPIAYPGFDPSAPSVEYDAGSNLGLFYGDRACFRVRAYSEQGESPPSASVCITI